MTYKQIVANIKALNWGNLTENELKALMIVSAYSALEFASTLRAGMIEEPKLDSIASGELATDNLVYEDYDKRGDHADFLWHFIQKYNVLSAISPEVIESGARYISNIASLPIKQRVMSIASRERELPDIFDPIIEVLEKTDDPALKAFRYYLARHVELDRGDEGHGNALNSVHIDESVSRFWETRLKFYLSALPQLARN